MRRKAWLSIAAWLAWSMTGLSAAVSAHAQSGVAVSVQQMEEAVARRFPKRYPVAGLLELTLQAPRLRLLPELNRLATEMDIVAAGAALARSTTGTFDVDFALRYEARDQTIRAHQFHINALRLSGLPPGPAALLDAYAPVLARQILVELVLHQLSPQDLALSDGLGLEPGAITVTARGLVISFVAKSVR